MYRIDAATIDQMDEVRGLFQEYAASLQADLCFQNFAAELAGLPKTYSPILVCAAPNGLAGCIALRALTSCIGEMKRLYVRPQHRGRGLGRMLTEAVLQAARDRNYQSVRLDTLPQLRDAIAMYRRMGFREIEPYYKNPVPGVLFLEIDLWPKTKPLDASSA